MAQQLPSKYIQNDEDSSGDEWYAMGSEADWNQSGSVGKDDHVDQLSVLEEMLRELEKERDAKKTIRKAEGTKLPETHAPESRRARAQTPVDASGNLGSPTRASWWYVPGRYV
ncbi:hypothetical protein FOZ60_012349 [Perkinsus olseni]|uniref:Uncharacterized protein n=1 Tax=Perkinsus olseni TaxID=32597 RepID=A0A7J6NEB2_PEROL|nr:hypothetical protein FOZ60_012349 [Perkinsus olseni]